MNIKKYFLPVMLAGAALGLIHRLFARAVVTPVMAEPGSTNGSYDAIDAYIEAQMRRLHIPGASLAIVEGDRITHLRGFGRARPDGETPTPQTPFFIGSLTKSITALAVMQLVEAGKIEIDSPVQRYLPWFRVADPEASAQMTVRHLLNHTSGIPMMVGLENLEDLSNDPGDLELQVRSLSRLKVSHPPGMKQDYNNTNYNILGLIVETASGESYTSYIQNHVFSPLEMAHSYASKAEAQKESLAVGHRYWFGLPIPCPDLEVPLSSLPSGQLISSAEDMAHYLIAQLNGGCYGNVRILSEMGIEEMHRGTAEIDAMGLSIGSYGMGWIDQVVGKTRIIWHSGIVPDFNGFMALLPGQKRGVILLVNANHAAMKVTYDEIGLQVAQLLAGDAPSQERFGALPWMTRAMLLIPIFQVAGIVSTLRLLDRWRANSEARPSRNRMWLRYILLPLLPNLLPALTLAPMLGKMRGFIDLFMPDYSLLARISGWFAGIWAVLRTGLVLRALGHQNE